MALVTVGAAAPEAQRDGLVREAEGVGEAGVGGRLLDGAEVLAEEVLAEGQLQGVPAGLRGGSEDGRDLGDPGLACGPEAALAGDEAVAVGVGLDDDRVEEAVEADGGGQSGRATGLEVAAGLLGVGVDAGGVDLEQGGAAPAQVATGVAAGEQGVESAAEAVAARRWRGGAVVGRARRALLGHAKEGVAGARAPFWRRASRLTASSR